MDMFLSFSAPVKMLKSVASPFQVGAIMYDLVHIDHRTHVFGTWGVPHPPGCLSHHMIVDGAALPPALPPRTRREEDEAAGAHRREVLCGGRWGRGEGWWGVCHSQLSLTHRSIYSAIQIPEDQAKGSVADGWTPPSQRGGGGPPQVTPPHGGGGFGPGRSARPCGLRD